MTDQTRTPSPTPSPAPTLLEAVTEEALRSSKRVAEVFIAIGSVGMLIAFVYGLSSLAGPDGASPAGFAGFVFALLFTSVAAINRKQAVRVLRKAGYDAGDQGEPPTAPEAPDAPSRTADTLDPSAATRGARVMAKALRLYDGDEAGAVRFLLTEHPMLDGESPWQLALGSEAGVERVTSLLDQADAGGPV